VLYADRDDADRKLAQIPPRAVLRELGPKDLAISTEVSAAAKETEFDAPRYNDTSSGFRSSLEGSVHDPVHLWVGGARGDMGPMSSPNDPVFFLHHCNVDRMWEAWMQRNNRSYQPNMSASPREHFGLRIDDVLPLTPGDIPIRATLDMTEVFRYDSFANTGAQVGEQF
jgi:tyrosinase